MKPLTLDDQALLQGVQPVNSLDDLKVGLWTDEELDAFLRSRNRGTRPDRQP
jgi:hypothetical protein